MKIILKQLISDLHAKSSTVYKKNLLRFFTTPINCIGVPKATAAKLANFIL